MKFFTLILTLLVTATAYSSVILDRVSPSESVADAHRYFKERLDPVLDAYIDKEIKPLTYHGGSFYLPSLARIIRNTKMDEVNAMIMHPDTKVVAKVGTDFAGIGPFCKRKGDYDFVLTGLIPMAYEAKKRNNLSKEAWDKLLHTLLNTRGNKHHTYNRFCGIKVTETENHVLMIESARYLTNQLLAEIYPNKSIYNNELNGFNKWFLKHLQQFLKNDFIEYNSRPYQGHAIFPLENLINYAKDERVRTAATLVLDYLSAKFAVQSSRLRRQVPISRQKGYSRRDEILPGDHETVRFAQLAGNFQIFQFNEPTWSYRYSAKTALFAGISDYRAPDMILDMIINTDQTMYQSISHNAFEMYTKTPEYVLSAGGRFWNYVDMGSGIADAWAYPTNVIPHKGNELKRSELLRIEGHKKEQRRNNTCMFKNFACGLNVKLPANLPASCIEKKGEWTFINYASKKCPLRYDYYAAVRIKKAPRYARRYAKNFGSIELMPAKKMDYNEFKEKVLNNNQTIRIKKLNTYTTAEGDVIEHYYKPRCLKRYPIIKINGKKILTKLSKWSFLKGNILNSNGNGLVIIKNPKLGSKLILDYRNPLKPTRTLVH
jgi:hypothetical protein